MYHYISTYVLPLTGHPLWETKDTRAKPLKDYFTDFKKSYLILRYLNQEVYVDLDTLEEQLKFYQLPITDYLNSLGSTTLPMTTKPPSKLRHVNWNAIDYGSYNVTPTDEWLTVNKKLSNKTPDLLINAIRHVTPLDVIGRYSLVTIDGLVHRVEYNQNVRDKVVITGGGLTCLSKQLKPNMPRFGLLDFTDIGEVTTKPLTYELEWSNNNLKGVRIEKYSNVELHVIMGRLLNVDKVTLIDTSDGSYLLNLGLLLTNVIQQLVNFSEFNNLNNILTSTLLTKTNEVLIRSLLDHYLTYIVSITNVKTLYMYNTPLPVIGGGVTPTHKDGLTGPIVDKHGYIIETLRNYSTYLDKVEDKLPLNLDVSLLQDSVSNLTKRAPNLHVYRTIPVERWVKQLHIVGY